MQINHDNIDELFVNETLDAIDNIDIVIGICYTTITTNSLKTFSVQRAIYDISAYIMSYKSQSTEWKKRLNQLIKKIDEHTAIKLANRVHGFRHEMINKLVKEFCEELSRKYPVDFSVPVEIICTGSTIAEVKVGLPLELDYIIISEDSSSFDSVETFFEYVKAHFCKGRQFRHMHLEGTVVDTTKTRVGACLVMKVRNDFLGATAGVLIDLVPAYKIKLDSMKFCNNPFIFPAKQYLRRHNILNSNGEHRAIQLVSQSRDYPIDFGFLANKIVQNMNADQKFGFRVAKYLLQNIVRGNDDLYTELLEPEESLRLFGRKPVMKSFYLRLCLLNILIHTDKTELGATLSGGALTLCLLDIMHKTFLKLKTLYDEPDAPESLAFSFADPLIGDFRLQYHLHWSKEQVDFFVRRISKIIDCFKKIVSGDTSRYRLMNHPEMDTVI